MLTKIGQVDGFLLVLLALARRIREVHSKISLAFYSEMPRELYGNGFAADNLNYARAGLLDPRIESEFVTRLVSSGSSAEIRGTKDANRGSKPVRNIFEQCEGSSTPPGPQPRK